MKSAWLVTWEWIGDHAAVDKKVVTIINYRKSASYVKDFIEQLYIETSASISNKYSYAKSAKNNLYPAKYFRVKGVDWSGCMYCGHNPHLYARRVKNLRITEGAEGECLEWDEIPIPSFDWDS